MYKTRIYKIYHAMKARCTYPKDPRYNKYGANGITVCEEWLGEDGFINFYNWSMENNYTDELTIDRIDSNGNYEPSNCRWVDYFVQSNNTNRNHRISYHGENHTIGEWSKILGINYNTLNQRIWSGIPIEVAMTNKRFKKGEMKKLIEVIIEEVD